MTDAAVLQDGAFERGDGTVEIADRAAGQPERTSRGAEAHHPERGDHRQLRVRLEQFGNLVRRLAVLEVVGDLRDAEQGRQPRTRFGQRAQSGDEDPIERGPSPIPLIGGRREHGDDRPDVVGVRMDDRRRVFDLLGVAEQFRRASLHPSHCEDLREVRRAGVGVARLDSEPMRRQRQRFGFREVPGAEAQHRLDGGHDIAHGENVELLGPQPEIRERPFALGATEEQQVHGAPTHAHEHEGSRLERPRDRQQFVGDRDPVVRVLRREHRVVED